MSASSRALAQVAAPRIQQWANDAAAPRRDPAQPSQAAAAGHAQEHGLGHVIGRVRRGDERCRPERRGQLLQEAVAHQASGVLERAVLGPGDGGDIGPVNAHSKPSADAMAATRAASEPDSART